MATQAIPVPEGLTMDTAPANPNAVPVPEGLTMDAGTSAPPTPEEHSLRSGMAKGLAQTVGGATELAGEAINRIPGVGETLAPRAGLDAEKNILQRETQLEGTPEKAGALIEAGGEWMAGDAALKALGKIGTVARYAPHLLELAEKYPVVAKLLFSTAQGGAIGAVQAGTKAQASGEDAGKAAVAGGVGGAVGGLAAGGLDAASESKLARGLINRSVGATARDVVYGNPAKALLDEGIKNPLTGDVEAYKAAIRAGKSDVDAAQAAGGRLGRVTTLIDDLKKNQLDPILKASKVRISVDDTVVKPLQQEIQNIQGNRAMTQAEKDLAVGKLNDIRTAMTKGFGKDISPAEATELKRQIGDRINWSGTSAVTDEIKPAVRRLYGSLKQAVHTQVPEVSALDERLTNLLAAHTDILKQSKTEEVLGGQGITAGGFVISMTEKEAGRLVPVLNAIFKSPARLALPALSSGFTRFTASDGSVNDVPTEHLDKARAIDPDLKVHE